MMLVVVTLLLTSPLDDGALHRAARSRAAPRYMFELGSRYGGAPMRMAGALTAATLLVGAANTAIIGCYHVFISLGRLGFLPRSWGTRRPLRHPHRAIVISVLIPLVSRRHPRQRRPARTHVHVRPARRVHVHLRRPGSDPLAGAAAGPSFWRDADLGADRRRLGDHDRLEPPGDAVRRRRHAVRVPAGGRRSGAGGSARGSRGSPRPTRPRPRPPSSTRPSRW